MNLNTTSRQNGQALPVALVALGVLTAMVWGTLRLGGLIAQREKLNHRLDMVAFSTGNAYARALNTIATTNKSYILAYSFAWIAPNLPKMAHKLQKGLIATTPLIAEAQGYATVFNNDVSALIHWNQKSPWQIPKLIPNVNLAANTAMDKLPGRDEFCGQNPKDCADEDFVRDAYSYRSGKTGQVHDMDPEFVRRLKNGSYLYHNPADPNKATTFVSRRRVFNFLALPLPVEDLGYHSILISGSNQPLGQLISRSLRAIPGLDRWLGRLAPSAAPPGNPLMTGFSRVEIGGGTMSITEFEGARYQAWFSPVQASHQATAVLPKGGILREGWNIAAAFLRGRNRRLDFGLDTLEDPARLAVLR